MTKFHINKHGVPAPCHAKEGNCPLGGSDSHFNTRDEAQAHINEVNEEKFGLMPELNKNQSTEAETINKIQKAMKDGKLEVEFKKGSEEAKWALKYRDNFRAKGYDIFTADESGENISISWRYADSEYKNKHINEEVDFNIISGLDAKKATQESIAEIKHKNDELKTSKGIEKAIKEGKNDVDFQPYEEEAIWALANAKALRSKGYEVYKDPRTDVVTIDWKDPGYDWTKGEGGLNIPSAESSKTDTTSTKELMKKEKANKTKSKIYDKLSADKGKGTRFEAFSSEKEWILDNRDKLEKEGYEIQRHFNDDIEVSLKS